MANFDYAHRTSFKDLEYLGHGPPLSVVVLSVYLMAVIVLIVARMLISASTCFTNVPSVSISPLCSHTHLRIDIDSQVAVVDFPHSFVATRAHQQRHDLLALLHRVRNAARLAEARPGSSRASYRPPSTRNRLPSLAVSAAQRHLD